MQTQILSGFALDQTNDGYLEAKRELKREFGNPVILVREYMKQIDSWGAIKSGDGGALRALTIFLKCLGSLPSLSHN